MESQMIVIHQTFEDGTVIVQQQLCGEIDLFGNLYTSTKISFNDLHMYNKVHILCEKLVVDSFCCVHRDAHNATNTTRQTTKTTNTK